MANVTLLGTGTSDGIPVLGCGCEVCTSKDPRDKRLRCSAYVFSDQGDHILIDCGPDFRIQALQYHIEQIDSLLISHAHFDHVGGIDELRQINRLMQSPIQVYGLPRHINEIRERVSYLFRDTQRGGGKAQIALNYLESGQHHLLGDTPILTLPVTHGSLEILGFRMGGLVYITDASFLSKDTMNLISDPRPQILILNALRFRPHSTHFNIEQSIQIAEQVRADKTYFIHMTHDILHERVEAELPDNIHLGWDGLTLNFDS